MSRTQLVEVLYCICVIDLSPCLLSCPGSRVSQVRIRPRESSLVKLGCPGVSFNRLLCICLAT